MKRPTYLRKDGKPVSLPKHQTKGPIYLPSINYVFPGQYIPNYLQHKVFETEEDFNKDRLLQIRNNYWPTKNNRVFDAGFDILNNRLGPRPVRMPSITSDYRGVAMMYGGTINKYQTKGGNESKLRLPTFSVEDDIQTSFYDPITERITLKYPVRPETLKHEMFHHFQNMKDYLRMPEGFPSMKKPQIPASEELYHTYMNRKANDIKNLLQEFRKESPEFEMVPDELIYRRHPYLEAKQYWIPNTVEGEADLAEYDPKVLANTPNMYSDKGYNMSEFDDLVKRFYQKYYPNIVKSKIKNQGLKTSKHQTKGPVLPSETTQSLVPAYMKYLPKTAKEAEEREKARKKGEEETRKLKEKFYKEEKEKLGASPIALGRAIALGVDPVEAKEKIEKQNKQFAKEAAEQRLEEELTPVDDQYILEKAIDYGSMLLGPEMFELNALAKQGAKKLAGKLLKKGSKVVNTPTRLPVSSNLVRPSKEKVKDLQGFLKRRQFLKELQKEKLVGDEFNFGDLNYAATSTDRTNALTKLALDRYHGGFRLTSGRVPVGGKGRQETVGTFYDMSRPAYGQKISEFENMANAGVDFSDPKSIAEYQATHIPMEDYGYRSTGEHPTHKYGFIFNASSPFTRAEQEYGTYQFKRIPKTNYDVGEYLDWYDQFYKNQPYHAVHNRPRSESFAEHVVVPWTKTNASTLVGPRGVKAYEIDKSFPFTDMSKLTEKEKEELIKYAKKYKKQYKTGWRGEYRKGGSLDKYQTTGSKAIQKPTQRDQRDATSVRVNQIKPLSQEEIEFGMLPRWKQEAIAQANTINATKVQPKLKQGRKLREDELEASESVMRKIENPWVYNPAGNILSAAANFRTMTPEEIVRTHANPEEALRYSALETLPGAVGNIMLAGDIAALTSQIPGALLRSGEFAGKLGEHLTTQTFLKNAFKLNPLAQKTPLFSNLAREGEIINIPYRDAKGSIENISNEIDYFHLKADPQNMPYPAARGSEAWETLSKDPRFFVKRTDTNPNAVVDFPISFGEDLVDLRKLPIPLKDLHKYRLAENVYGKPNWLKGYPKVSETPLQLPGSPNSIENLASVVSTPKTGAWQMEELPGLHLKSTMSDGAISKIVEPKTGLVNTEQALGIIAKESGGKEKVELIKQAFGENIPKKIDYNEFRKVVQNQLVPLEKQIVSSNSNYGINRLGYLSPKKSSYDQAIKTTKDAIARGENVTENTAHLEGLLKEYEQLPLENQTLVLSNKNKFGRGSSAHDNPDETLGHIHFLRDAESPDVLTVTQIQSDAFQGTHRIMPKNKEQAMKSLESMQKHADMLDDYYSKAEPVLSSEKFGRPGEYRWYKLPDGRTVSKEIIEEGSKKQRYLNELSKNELENFSQKQLLDKHHQERYIQELVQYAGERGDINKLRLPTSETAAKVQNYKPVTNSSQIIEEYSKVKGTPKWDELTANLTKDEKIKLDKILKGEIKGDIYDTQAETILKKYTEQPKTIKKLFGVEPKIVTDGKGNTWYEFDIPKSFKEGKGELKAFRVGGSTGEKEKRNSNWNTFKKSLAEDMSQQGYRRTSKYKNLPFIVINNGDSDIDMTETDFPIYAISNKGEERIMEPGTIQEFEGDQVLEIPMHQTEGAVGKPPVYSGNPNDKEALRKWAEEYVAWEQGQKDNMRTWAEQQVQREMTTAPQLTATTYTENIRPKKAVAENKDTFKVVREKTQDNRSINKSINDSKIPVSTKKEKTPLITAEELRSETTQMFRPSVDPFKRDQTLQSSSNQGFETENENINVENVGEESLWESAKRFIGSWLPEDQKGTVKVKPEFKTKSSLLKRIEEQELGKNPVNIKNDDFGYKEYGESSDVGKNKLAIFTHGFDNDSGAKYKVGHMVLELKNPKNPKKFSGVKAVAHFIRNGDILPFTNPEFGKSYKTKSGFEMKSTSTGKYLSSPADQTPEDYVMLYRKDKDDNTFTIKYKKQKDLTTDDIRNYPDSYDKQNKRFDLNVKSYRFADVDWDAEGKRAPGFGTGIKFIPLKKGSPSTQRNRTTSLPYNSKNVFSRFSGASVIFVFKDPKTGKSIGIDAAGSIEFLKETGNGIINKYKINPEELDVLHHDLGSYSAKPKAKNNVLDYSQWMNFNTIDKGKSGAPIMIVDEEVPNPPARQLNQKKSGGSVTKNMSKITYLSKTGKLVSK